MPRLSGEGVDEQVHGQELAGVAGQRLPGLAHRLGQRCRLERRAGPGPRRRDGRPGPRSGPPRLSSRARRAAMSRSSAAQRESVGLGLADRCERLGGLQALEGVGAAAALRGATSNRSRRRGRPPTRKPGPRPGCRRPGPRAGAPRPRRGPAAASRWRPSRARGKGPKRKSWQRERIGGQQRLRRRRDQNDVGLRRGLLEALQQGVLGLLGHARGRRRSRRPAPGPRRAGPISRTTSRT